MITVWVHSLLLADAKTDPEISVEIDRPISLGDLLLKITNGDELFHFRLVNELGQLRPHINIFVGSEKRNNLDFVIERDEEVSIFPAVSGGQRKMIGDDFRGLAQELEGAIESAHMGHADFRVGGKIFATLNSDETLGMVKLSNEEQLYFIERSPEIFSPCAGAWGRAGSTHINLAAVDEATLKNCLELAWRKFVKK